MTRRYVVEFLGGKACCVRECVRLNQLGREQGSGVGFGVGDLRIG